MSAPKWQPSITYLPGAIVQPTTAVSVKSGQPTNNDFESGATSWTLGATTAIATDKVFSGTQSLKFTGTTTLTAGVLSVSTDLRPVIPGQSVTGQCYGNTGGNSGGASAEATLVWYNSSSVQIGTSGQTAAAVTRGSWQLSTVTANAPAGAAYVAIGVTFFRVSGSTDSVWADLCSWNYTYVGSPSGMLYEAVQTASAKSGGTEPAWPTTLGSTVVDGGVTWKAVQATLLQWTASPLNLSGSTEPTWPTVPGGVVNDNGVLWLCTAGNVTDPNCPNTPQVTILSSKVFAANQDITSFCATNNPLDWSTTQDAGFLATGFQSVGETYTTALGQYRGQLVVWTGSALLLWQTDPDPAQMGLTDTFEGGGTSYYKAGASVSGDLFYLSPRGVRAVSVTAGTGNMEASTSAGLPVDVLVQPAVQGIQPIGIYYPGAGQYWLICGTQAFVLTVDEQDGPSWSRYTFATAITGATILDGLLYLRDATTLYVLDENTYQDNGQNFEVLVQWPWVDLDTPGALKQLIGFDVVFAEIPPVFALMNAFSGSLNVTGVVSFPGTFYANLINRSTTNPGNATLAGVSFQLFPTSATYATDYDDTGNASYVFDQAALANQITVNSFSLYDSGNTVAFNSAPGTGFNAQVNITGASGTNQYYVLATLTFNSTQDGATLAFTAQIPPFITTVATH